MNDCVGSVKKAWIIPTALQLLVVFAIGAPPAASTVGVAELVLTDASRHRDIPVKVYFPREAGLYPIVIFSHGLGGSKDGYEFLGRYWAAHGYVSIHPSHSGSDQAILTPGRPAHNLAAMKRAAHDEENWIQRPRDISFVISSLNQIEIKAPELTGRLAKDRVGVAGHSFGAYTAMAVAGAQPNIRGQAVSFKDDRPLAFVALSPQGESEFGWTQHSWDGIRRPFMAMSGTEDRGMGGEPPEWRLEAYRHMPEGDKYQVVIEGANHLTFSGAPGTSTTKMLESIEVLTTAFWDAYLNGRAEDRKRLQVGAAWKGPGAHLESK